jgi:ubiquinone/menaquinone biosynthesis C-methylase UbiE
MLDIGVGGGRTSPYFMDQVREYIGIDYSEQMINVCKTRFSSNNKNISFHLCDARSMPIFEDAYFDFILFSFNGIDSISFEDRIKALREIKRLGKKGGFFIFSSHNLNYILKKLTIKFGNNLFTTAKHLGFLFLFKAFNENNVNMEESGYCIINDGSHFYRLRQLYIRPTEQIKQLGELGFNNIRIFSFFDGKEITRTGELQENTDPYLYYLCNF